MNGEGDGLYGKDGRTLVEEKREGPTSDHDDEDPSGGTGGSRVPTGDCRVLGGVMFEDEG